MIENIAQKEFFGNTLWDYAVSIGIVLIAILLGKFMVWLGKNKIQAKAEQNSTTRNEVIHNIFQAPFACGVVLLVLWISVNRLDFTETVEVTISKIFGFLSTLNITWILVRLARTFCDHYLWPKASKGEMGRLDKNVILTIRKALSVLLWAIGLLMAIEGAGVDIKALLTTLGIGGIAVALASQDTVKNVIGGITVFLDRTFRIGDRIKVGSYEGYVEDVGVRSTRLRTPDGYLITMPNYQVVEGAVQNLSLEPARKITKEIALSASTTGEQIDQAIAILKHLPADIKEVRQEVLAAFTGFSSSQLTLTFVYYIKRGKDLYGTQTTVNKYLLQKFSEQGIILA